MKANLFIRFGCMEHAYQNYMDYCAHEGLSVMSTDQFKESCITSVQVYLSAIYSLLTKYEIKYLDPLDGDGFWDYEIPMDLNHKQLNSLLDEVNSEIFTHSTDKTLHYTFRSFYYFQMARDMNVLFAINPLLIELDVDQYE